VLIARAPIRARGALVAVLAASGCGAAHPAGDAPPRACPAGDVTVQVDGEAAALAGCDEVRGDLAVGPSFALRTLVDLARLERVRGRLDVSDNVLVSGLFLPGLVAVGGDLVIEDNRELTTASLHRLVEVSGDLIVRGNRALERLDLGALRRVGGRLEIAWHPLLDTVVLDRLERARELRVDGVPSWSAEEVERVRRALERHRRARP
jgi:hypothetical protein